MSPRLVGSLLGLALAASGGAAFAQGRPAPSIPDLPRPVAERAPPLRDLPATPRLDRIPDRTAGALPPVAEQARTLARAHPEVLELDRRTGLRIRGEVVAVDPSPAALTAALQAGFTQAGETRLETIGVRVVLLRARPGQPARAALRQLRRMDPGGDYDFNHVFLASASPSPGEPMTASSGGSTRLWPSPPRVGLVDSGVDAGHPALAGVDLSTWGCGGSPRVHPHGTAVASLLVEAANPATSRQLLAADIYCDQPRGGEVMALAAALDWLAGQQVAVINISLVGADNRLLSTVIGSMVERGHVLVAAVGNDGPRSAPLYPAAYPGVLAVTAVDERGRLLPESVRGPHARFAAPGSGLQAASLDGGWSRVRGTSFAAPLVARLAASRAGSPEPGLAGRVTAELDADAQPLGPVVEGRQPPMLLRASVTAVTLQDAR
ncbi:MAG: S8 family serine peptidase [Lysobacteraceae bacterium]